MDANGIDENDGESKITRDDELSIQVVFLDGQYSDRFQILRFD
jgi:hypothetical protein